MSENLLSVFKKELGYVNATNQYVELSIRITEKEHSLDLRNNLQGLAQSVNLNVSTLTEDYMCRISKSYIVNIHSCLENFLKSFKHLPGSPTNITEIKKTSEDDWLEWTLNIALSMRTTHRSNMKRCFAICTRYLPSTKIFLWTTILANSHSEVLPKSILSPKPQSNGD